MTTVDETEAMEILAAEVERLQTALDMTNSELDSAMDRITDLQDELWRERYDNDILKDRVWDLEEQILVLEENQIQE